MDENNVLRIDQINADFTQSLNIDLFSIKILGIRDVAVENGKIELDDSIKVFAKAVIPEGDIIHGTFNDIIATPTIEIPTMYIRQVDGNVDMDLSQYIQPQSIDLSNINSIFEKNNIQAVLGLKSSNICLEVANPIGVAVDGELHLTAQYSSGEPLTLDVPIHLNGAEGDGKGITRLCLTNNASSAPAGYTAIVPEGYDKLLEKIPTSLDLDITGAIDPDNTCSILLGDDYVFDINLSVQIPMALSSTSNISYKTAFREIQFFKDFGNFNVSIDEIGVMLETTSTLPLEFSVEAKAIDVDSIEVDDVQLIVDGTIGGCLEEYQPKVSRLFIGFSGNTSQLSRVDGIALSLTADIGDKEEAMLNANQYLKARAILSAKKGITANLTDIIKALMEKEERDEEDDDELYE